MTPSFSWGSDSVNFPYGFIVTASKEFIRNEAGIALAEKHTITIKGSIPTGSLTGSIGTAISVLNSGAGGGTSQIGLLKISGGVEYGAARLVSVSTAEPPEDTAGIQYIEVTLTFESYSGSGGPPLRSTSSSIEVRRDDDKISNSNPNEAYFGFIVTHTVSAQGIASGVGDNGFSGAQAWVGGQISSSSAITSTTDGGAGTGGSFNVSTVPGVGNVTDCTITRSITADVANASYSVTTTYFKSKYLYFTEMTASVQRDENGEMYASAQGTVQGYASGGVNATESNAAANAAAGWAALGGFAGIYGYVTPVWNAAGDKPGIGGLHDYPVAYSLGKNPARGTYTFNVTYKAYTSVVEGLRNQIAGDDTLSASLTVTDDNKGGEIQIFASIPIIGRAAGPILQDMGTTNSRRRTVTVEGTVKPVARTAYNSGLIDKCYGICKTYMPDGTSYMTSKNGSWDANTGRVSATIEWTYE